MVVGLILHVQSVPITTSVVSSNLVHGEVHSTQHCDRSVVFSTNKTDYHDMTDILLKVALNTIHHQFDHLTFWYFQTVLTLFIADIRHIVCNIVFVFVGRGRQMSYVPRTFKWLTARFSMSDGHNLSEINAFKNGSSFIIP